MSVAFRQKEYSEHDALRLFFIEWKKRRCFPELEVIGPSELIPVLKGNNVVIEKVVISTSFFGSDRYRLYFKLGARVNLPPSVHLPQESEYTHYLGRSEVSLQGGWKSPYGGGGGGNNPNQNPNNNNPGGRFETRTHSSTEEDESLERFFGELQFEEKEFGKKKGGGGGGNNNGDGGLLIKANYKPEINLSYKVREPLGETIKYDRTSRTLVLEYTSLDRAFKSLSILPFGLQYKLYLLSI